MKAQNIIYGLVAVTIAVIITTSAVVPIFMDTTKTTDTYTNEGYFRMSHYDDTTDHTFTWTYETPNIVTVDSVDVTINYNVPNGQVTLIADTNWILRAYTGNDGSISGISWIGTSGGTTSAQVSNNETISLSLSSGTTSGTIGSTSKSGTYTDIWIPSNDGLYLMKKADKIAYINGDSSVVGYGMSRPKDHNGNTTSSPGYGIMLIGTYDDGFDGIVWRGSETGSISDVEINATVNNAHDDLYTFDKITATFTLTETIDDETVTTDTELIYNYVIVPYQVTAERSAHPDGPTSTIINIIPLIIVAGILLLAIVFFIRRA